MIRKKIVEARIISNKEVAKGYFVIRVEAPYLGRLSRPGQFVNVKLDEKTTDPLLRIPLGVHAIRETGIDLLYKVAGYGTKLLSRKKKTEKMNILGPLGKGFDLTDLTGSKDKKTVIVAGGHGVAPLYALAKAILTKKIQVDFLMGASSKEHIVYAEEINKLGAQVYIATDDGTWGYKGNVTELLSKQLQYTTPSSNTTHNAKHTTQNVRCKTHDAKHTTIYACGPQPMLAALARVTKKTRINAQVSLDAYVVCGIGACLGCAILTHNGYKMVCKDGPVFDAKEVDWKNI